MNTHPSTQLNIDAAEYNRLCMPVVAFSWIFIAIAAMGILYGFLAFWGLFSPISESMELGNQFFGIYGAAMAGQAKAEALSNLKNMNPALQDVEDYSFMLFFISIVLGFIIAVLSGLSIARTKDKNKFGVNILSAFYFLSGLLATVIIIVFCTLCIAQNASEHFSDPQYIVPNTLLSVVLIGFLVFYYIKSYRSTLIKMVTVRPQQTAYEPIRNSSAPKMPLTVSNNPDADKPTKSCPYCGETILAVAVKCKHCGEWLPKEELKKMVECPICGEMIEEGVEICPYCHEKTDGSTLTQPEPKMITCPVCAEQIPDNVSICPICNEKIK